MSKSIQISISSASANNGWKNLNILAQAAYLAASKSAPRPYASSIILYNDNVPPVDADCRLQFTRDPTTSIPITKGLLPEESKEFADQGAVNGQSLLDIWVRLVQADLSTLIAGTATIELSIG